MTLSIFPHNPIPYTNRIHYAAYCILIISYHISTQVIIGFYWFVQKGNAAIRMPIDINQSEI